MAQCVCGSSSQASDIVYWLGLPSIDRALCFLMPSSGQINTRSSGLLDDLFLLCVHLSSVLDHWPLKTYFLERDADQFRSEPVFRPQG